MTSSDRSRHNRLHGPQPTPTTPSTGARSGDPARTGQLYTRFIPREELGSFANWSPDAIGAGDGSTKPPVERRAANGDRRAAAPAAPPSAAEAARLTALQQQHAAALKAARQQGYQDGYRDGLVALDNFKQTFAQQITAQVGQLFEACGQQLEGLQERMAEAMATTAVQLARQVVRQEVATRPDLVLAVARDAIESLLASARGLRLRVHPDDHAVLLEGARELFDRRGVTLVTDAGIARGGCRLESDLGVVDAEIATRWAAAAAVLGRPQVEWVDTPPKPTP
jgi:flagellar assembly protein FliH